MLEAMIAGQRNPRVLAQLARASMRAKIEVLREALTGHFDDHHAFMGLSGRVKAVDGFSHDLNRSIEAKGIIGSCEVVIDCLGDTHHANAVLVHLLRDRERAIAANRH